MRRRNVQENSGAKEAGDANGDNPQPQQAQQEANLGNGYLCLIITTLIFAVIGVVVAGIAVSQIHSLQASIEAHLATLSGAGNGSMAAGSQILQQLSEAAVESNKANAAQLFKKRLASAIH